jgi:hypothetical protein
VSAAMCRADTTAPSPSLRREVASLERRMGTWEMSPVELAKVYAVHVGHYGAAGGWIYSASHKPLAQGWAAYADRLVQRRVIVPGRGINWRSGR